MVLCPEGGEGERGGKTALIDQRAVAAGKKGNVENRSPKLYVEFLCLLVTPCLIYLKCTFSITVHVDLFLLVHDSHFAVDNNNRGQGRGRNRRVAESLALVAYCAAFSDPETLLT